MVQKLTSSKIPIAAYWIEPNGELHNIGGLGSHRKWLQDNTKLLFDDAISGGWMQMWHTPGTELSFYLDKLRSIPDMVNDMILSYAAPIILVADSKGGTHSAQVDYGAVISDGIQKAINKAVQQKRKVEVINEET